MIKSVVNRGWAIRAAILLTVTILWAVLADEHYAGLIRSEHECISNLMDKTGAEHHWDLEYLANYQYRNCQIYHREWGMLERFFVMPASLYR